MRPVAIVGVLFCASIVGCFGSGDMPTYQVTGKVAFPDGSPLKGGWIIFNSVDHPGANARGTISKEDGTFLMGTHVPDDGAVVGQHRVSIQAARPEGFDPDNPAMRNAPAIIDPRFTRPDTSGLQFEVTSDGENHFEIEVQAEEAN